MGGGIAATERVDGWNMSEVEVLTANSKPMVFCQFARVPSVSKTEQPSYYPQIRSEFKEFGLKRECL